MATYNNNLRIAEIATGDEAGVWGNTTNYNLATLLTQAISGVTQVPVVSSAQALVSTDGVSDEARQAVIELTGTPGSNFFIYTPPANKVYIFKNSVATYTATIRVATARNGTTQSGATEIAIASGRTVMVFTTSSGTPSIYEAINNIAGNFLVNGGLAVGGNGVFAGTGGVTIPVGTTLEQAGGQGTIRYNTTLSRFEGNNGTEWGGIGGGGGSGGGGGATGGGQNQVFYENEQTVNVSYTIPAVTNAMTAGPITIQPGFVGTATLSNGSTGEGNILNVITQTAGALYIGTIIEGTGVPANTSILEFGTGTGTTGTYIVSNSATLTTTFDLTTTVEVTITPGSNWIVVG